MIEPLIAIVLFAFALEVTLGVLIFWLRQDCAWLIVRKDLNPKIDADGLNAFLEHGWDKELGWVRKPNTRHGEIGKERVRTSYSLDGTGARKNPGFEDQPPSVLAYGDSYTFARQVNDHETWPHLLSKMINANVGNYGVGNYGLDQALLRLEREFDDHPAPVIIMGLVPETISRILSVWKHFSEYGNTFGFKPRFVLNDDGLELLPNVINDPEKYFRIPEYLDRLKADDYFYTAKFSRDILHFPFLWRLATSWKRNLPLMAAALTDKLGLTKERAFLKVMERNIDLAAGLYRDPETSALFKAICHRFIDFARDRSAEPVLVMMPQLLDIDLIRKGDHYYKHILDELALKMTVIDLAPILLEQENTDALFIHDSYGGHLSSDGNRIVAETLTKTCEGLLSKSGVHTSPKMNDLEKTQMP
jgi:hypothetical protein